MVIPMGGSMGQNIRGPVPAECQQMAQRMKYVVFAMGGCIVARLVTAAYIGILAKDFMNLLNLVMVILLGIFVLKDDVQIKPMYDFLASSICSQCHEQGMGGLGCIMPFGMCCGINFVMDLLFKSSQVVDPRMMPYGLFLGGTIVVEGAGAFCGYQIFKIVRDNGLGQSPDMEMNSGGMGAMGGGLLGGAGGARNYQPAPGGADQSVTPAAEAPAAGFVPFGGGGQRLGS